MENKNRHICIISQHSQSRYFGEKRAAFIASHQIKDETLWYDGLLCEWNNKTGVQLSPDNYDTIGGWRIYEVSCDDPGLAKPAFLSSKQTMLPNQDEIAALDHYLDRFGMGLVCSRQKKSHIHMVYMEFLIGMFFAIRKKMVREESFISGEFTIIHILH